MHDTPTGDYEKNITLLNKSGEEPTKEEENLFTSTPFEKWWGVAKLVGIHQMGKREKLILRWGIILSVSYFLVFDDFVQWFFIIKN
ncbi:MAG: hypothetical protein OXF24_06380 [Hyphomicrobiales bacterium]|nr:hypothetical protein [Hyphomicrobiales bacterium]